MPATTCAAPNWPAKSAAAMKPSTARKIVRATETWITSATRIEGIVAKLAKAGEAWGTTVVDSARERQTAQARLATEQAEMDHAGARLAALLGDANETFGRLDGPLLPVCAA